MFKDVLEVAKPLLEEEYLLSFDGKTFDKTFDKLVDQDYDIKLGKKLVIFPDLRIFWRDMIYVLK